MSKVAVSFYGKFWKKWNLGFTFCMDIGIASGGLIFFI